MIRLAIHTFFFLLTGAMAVAFLLSGNTILMILGAAGLVGEAITAFFYYRNIK